MQRTHSHPVLAWDEVRLFLALCRGRTVGHAAEALGVDASTVSRRLAALEKGLDLTLFDRGRQGAIPTEAAEELLPVAEEMEDALRRFASAAEGLEREGAGLVRITCPADGAGGVLAPKLAGLFTPHPALRISIDPSEAVLDLTRHEADLALRTVRPTRGDLVVTGLIAVPWVLVASPKMALQLGTLQVWKDAPWIGWGERLSGSGPARWLSEHAPGLEPRVRSDSLRVQLAVVAAGGGVALVPEPSVEHYGFVPIRLGAALRDAAARWP